MKFSKVSKRYNIFISDEISMSANKPVVLIENNVYYRFMNRLYISDHVYNLPIEYVIELNDIRNKYSEVIIDSSFNDIVYKRIIDSVSHHHKSPKNILDFGCGEGNAFAPIRNVFNESKIYGFDVRKIETPNAYTQLNNCSIDVALPYTDNQFSIVFAFFVFQFHINDFQISEIRRILNDDGILAFNLINSSDFNVLNRLNKAGFKVVEDIEFNETRNTGRGFLFYVSKL